RREAVANYKQCILISELGYFDWNDAPGLDSVVVACSRKDLSYQHESEVRAIILDAPAGTRQRTGISLPTDIAKLITEIMVGPREQEWVAALIKRILKRYKMSWPILVSDRLTARH